MHCRHDRYPRDWRSEPARPTVKPESILASKSDIDRFSGRGQVLFQSVESPNSRPRPERPETDRPNSDTSHTKNPLDAVPVLQWRSTSVKACSHQLRSVRALLRIAYLSSK